MPFQLAMSVAAGRIGLSEALERMARNERAEAMMEKHDLSKALATQIVMGHADLQAVLRRRRLDEHRRDFGSRSVLVDLAGTDQVVIIAIHGKKRVTGKVLSTDVYTVQFLEDGHDEPTELHKLQMKFGHAPDDWKLVRKATRTDKTRSRTPEAPIARPQDRYTCSDKRLFRYVDEATEVKATLLEGEVLKGRIKWFSRFELGLEIKGDASVIVFRHALADLGSA
jgi:sRNA-binding regulator protein Hfq